MKRIKPKPLQPIKKPVFMNIGKDIEQPLATPVEKSIIQEEKLPGIRPGAFLLENDSYWDTHIDYGNSSSYGISGINTIQNEQPNVQFIEPSPYKSAIEHLEQQAKLYKSAKLEPNLEQDLRKIRFGAATGIPSMAPNKVYYPKPDVEEDHSDLDIEREEEDMHIRKEQDDYGNFLRNRKAFILKSISLFMEEKDNIYLTKLLVLHFYHILENAIAFNNLKAKYREYNEKNVKNFVKKDLGYFVEYLERDCGLKSSEYIHILPEIDNILSLIYNFKINPNETKTLFIDINSSDCFLEVLSEAKSRNISIDKDILELNIDFKELRSQYNIIKLVYILPLNQLILESGDFKDPSLRGRNQITFLKYIKNIYPFVPSKEITDFVTINGKDYSKQAFESITESSLDSFLSILDVESLIIEEEKSDVADHEF